VRSADGFKFNLDVSQIIHIPRNDAPKVIARFGGMSALVTQVLAIAHFNAEAGVKSAEGSARARKINAEGDARAKKINAEADATVLRSVGDAEAAKTHAVGSAEAEVIKLKIASMESGNYAMVQVAEALAKSGVKLVPDIVAGGGGSGGTLVDVLLANVIRDWRALPHEQSATAR
jgi:hypothetical protein